jgi:hypothetical protein
MKNKTLIATGWLMLILTIYPVSAQTKNQNLGLIAELLRLKYTCELNLAQSTHPVSSDDTLQKYLTAYTLINSMISQMEADMIASNSLSEYRKLDNLLKENRLDLCKSNNTQIQKYIEIVKTDSHIWDNPISGKSIEPLSLLSSAVGITGDIVGIIKNISNLKKEKVIAICQYLDSARLKNPADILKQETSKK